MLNRLFFKNRVLRVAGLLAFSVFFLSARHPFYLSVTAIKHNVKDKSLNITCKLFTNDFEEALRKLYKKKIDLIHGANRQEQEQYIQLYMQHHLRLKVNGKALTYTLIGYEQEAEAVWCYLEATKTDKIKILQVENTILYDFIKEQVNICQVEVKGVQKSEKVSAPEKQMTFLFDAN